jgi:hypothetical protein
VPVSAGLVPSLFPSSANNSERFREISLVYLRGADILPMSQRRDEGEKKMKTTELHIEANGPIRGGQWYLWYSKDNGENGFWGCIFDCPTKESAAAEINRRASAFDRTVSGIDFRSP